MRAAVSASFLHFFHETRACGVAYAGVHRPLQDMPAAEAKLQALLKVDQSPELYRVLGEVKLEQQKLKEAVEAYETYLKKTGDQNVFAVEVGVGQCHRGKHT